MLHINIYIVKGPKTLHTGSRSLFSKSLKVSP